MTEVEKAEEYAIIVYKNLIRDKVNPLDKIVLNEGNIEQAYLDGLAEGRKEKCLEQNNDGTIHPCEVMKENAELKAQIEQLSNDNHVLKTAFITQQAQIEKMKNVGNCKHSMKCAKWNEKQLNLGLMKFCQNCKDWELAE